MHPLIVHVSAAMHIYAHIMCTHVVTGACMRLELEALHLGPGMNCVLIIPVSIKQDYFPKARMHDSSMLIDQCLGASGIVYVCLCQRVK